MVMRPAFVALLSLGALGAAGCSSSLGVYHCQEDSDCNLEGQGGAVCEADKLCSFSDPDCGIEGQRYGSSSGELSGECVAVADCQDTQCDEVCGDNACTGAETADSCPKDCEIVSNPSWTRRMQLSFSNSTRNEDLDAFPVLVVLDPTMIDYSVMQSAGQDLRFIDSDLTTELAYDIESWDASGLSYIWVQVPRIDAASSTDHMWMYYGNSDASAGQNAAAVWSGSYASVWHLSETSPGSFQDSTGNGNTLTSNGGIAATQLVDGQVAGSLDVDGADDYLSGANSSSLDIAGDMTLMAWVYVDSWNSSFPRIIHYDSNSELYVLALSGDNGTSNEARSFWAGRDNLDATALPDSVSLNTWTHLTGVFDSTMAAWTLYKDGVAVTTGNAGNISSNKQQLSIGVRDGFSPQWHLDGVLDEVRVVAAARSAAWVSAQHASMQDSFLIYGSEEEL